jgi:hypothetical protein
MKFNIWTITLLLQKSGILNSFLSTGYNINSTKINFIKKFRSHYVHALVTCQDT